MKKTYEEVLNFANAAKNRLGQKTKLSYAIERVMKSYAAQTSKLYSAHRGGSTGCNRALNWGAVTEITRT